MFNIEKYGIFFSNMKKIVRKHRCDIQSNIEVTDSETFQRGLSFLFPGTVMAPWKNSIKFNSQWELTSRCRYDHIHQ